MYFIPGAKFFERAKNKQQARMNENTFAATTEDYSDFWVAKILFTTDDNFLYANPPLTLMFPITSSDYIN